MAGSYWGAHMGLVPENGGDAIETLEEMLWLIYRCIGHEEAERLLKEEYYPMARGEKEPDEHFVVVEEIDWSV